MSDSTDTVLMKDDKQTWLAASFMPTAFFSLKAAGSTSSGGKSLLAPTAFAIKMALLDVALRIHGPDEGERLFPAIRDLQIAIHLPAKAIVNNTFSKILRPHKSGAKDTYGTGLLTLMGNTIAFREFVSFNGLMGLAFLSTHTALNTNTLSELIPHLTYFGKRGGFFQLQSLPQVHTWSNDSLRENGYVLLTQSSQSFDSRGLLQMMDDCSPKMTFDHANIYSSKKITLGKERVLHHVVLPYQLVRASKSYSYYQVINNSEQ